MPRLAETQPFNAYAILLNSNISIVFGGVVPGSLTDETSPFNECSHAYLAGTSALLAHMEKMPAVAADAKALSDKIELEMLANGSARVLCRYSGEAFNTGEIIMPRMGYLPLYLLLGFIGVVGIIGGCAALSSSKEPYSHFPRLTDGSE
jgi:hypothetical protein